MDTINWSAVGVIVQLIIAIVGFGVAIVRVSFVVGEKMGEIDRKLSESIATTKGEFNARLEMFEKTQAQKVDRVYERFDEHKKMSDGKFVLKDMCQVMHTSTGAQIIELKVAIADLSKKVDRLLERNG